MLPEKKIVFSNCLFVFKMSFHKQRCGNLLSDEIRKVIKFSIHNKVCLFVCLFVLLGYVVTLLNTSSFQDSLNATEERLMKRQRRLCNNGNTNTNINGNGSSTPPPHPKKQLMSLRTGQEVD